MSRKKSNSVGGMNTGIDNTRLDVVLTGSKGSETVTLQLSTWRDGQGWKVQKTIPLVAGQLGKLQRLLSQARNAVTDRRVGTASTAQVIPFGARRPAPAALPAAQPRRKNRKAAN